MKNQFTINIQTVNNQIEIKINDIFDNKNKSF